MGGDFVEMVDRAFTDLLRGGNDPVVGPQASGYPDGANQDPLAGAGAPGVSLPESKPPEGFKHGLVKRGPGGDPVTLDTHKAASGVQAAKLLRSGVSTASGVAAFLQKQPEVRGPKPPPRGASEAGALAAERERMIRGRGGRRSTILTSPLGVTAKPNLGVASLLGT